MKEIRYIEARDIRMVFSGTTVLDGINFGVARGEVVALVGENGAGKSTLMKIFSGVYQKTSGSILLEGEPVDFQTTAEAIRHGITMIYQELANLPKLSVAENVFLGRLPLKNKIGAVDFEKLYAETEEVFRKYGIEIDVRAKVESLSVAEKQFVEIVKAITAQDAKIVIMDEPTSSLTKDEIARLFRIIAHLKQADMGVVYISHRLDEVVEIADRVVVFRDGRNRGELHKGEYDEDKIVSLMIGHSLAQEERVRIERSQVVYEVKNLSIERRMRDFNMKLYKGEILGISGLMGSGKDELVKCLFGLWPAKSKEVYFKGELIDTSSPRKVLKKGIVYLPEERKIQSLFLDMSVKNNISAIWRFYKEQAEPEEKVKNETTLSQTYIERLSIKTPDGHQIIRKLSGGNQQKAVIARLLAVHPQIMILNDPTRGIDIGSKEEIYGLIRQLAKEGTSIVLVSSELEEVCKLANRVMVLSKGEVCGEFVDDAVTMENILPCAVTARTKR